RRAVPRQCLRMRHGSAGLVYNVGSGRPQRTRDVVHALLRAHDLDPALIDERPGGHGVGSDVADVWADITRLRALGPVGAGPRGEGDHDERRTG
ncbi:MAG TPA: hypothetical protein PLW65_26675, partial [Pseudomonadota bacterium]|nr:hypothetical protein [Pseudomonadota bacterium]